MVMKNPFQKLQVEDQKQLMLQLQQQQLLTHFYQMQNLYTQSNASIPSSLQQLKDHCNAAYPNQEPVTCFNRGPDGIDRLEHIYVFKNQDHWHYVGFGLADLHNYEIFFRINESLRAEWPDYKQQTTELEDIYHTRSKSQAQSSSGFGFELTFRVKCNSQESWEKNQPPRWPVKTMQALAKYVYHSKTPFNVGDHTAWSEPLSGKEDDPDDYESSKESIIRNMLMTVDSQLDEVELVTGKVRFIQLVGVTQAEMEAARKWNVRGILEIMKESQETGGPFLVTDMTRGLDIFQINPEIRARVDDGIQQMGSDMTMASVKHKFSYRKPKWFSDAGNVGQQRMGEDDDDDDDDQPMINEADDDERDDMNDDLDHMAINDGVERGNLADLNLNRAEHGNYNCPDQERCPSRISYESESALEIKNLETTDERKYNEVYLLLSLDSARILPLILNDRLRHRKDFTFSNFKGDLFTTFVPENPIKQAIVCSDEPYKKKGPWLFLYIPNQLRETMLHRIMEDFGQEVDEESLVLPKNYCWPEHSLYITVVRDRSDIPD